MKKELYDKFLKELGNCRECINLQRKGNKDCSLINIYGDNEFCKNIPSIWTDWFNRLNSEIMIIGQDWGPYSDMKSLNELYMLNFSKDNWKCLIEQEKSNTKKQLEYYIRESSNNRYSLDNIFITNAIMCARKGSNYRGNNINLKRSTNNCSKYLVKQIEIVKPKVILTLGYYPILSLSKSYNFKIEKNLRETIIKYPEIKVNDYIIIPLYHPVAQIKKSEQIKQYNRIWKYVSRK